jgi:GNAT superfamily N-acetyltransferase
MVTQRFIIRKATFGDVGKLHELIELSVRGLQKGDYTPQQIEGSLGYALGLDTQLIEDGTFFAAMPESGPETIVGCGGWSFRRTLFGSDHGPDREQALLDPASEPAKIRAIFVHPDWARRGLGTLILKHCEDAAQEAGFRMLEMGSTLTGVHLYSLKGYVKERDFAIRLPNGEVVTVFHMVKRLAN